MTDDAGGRKGARATGRGTLLLPDPADLRAALAEARTQAPAGDPAPVPEPVPEPVPDPAPSPDAAWEGLRLLRPDARLLARNHVVTAGRADPAHGAFDVLRTKIVQALRDRGWRRLGITSPTKGCGKTFTALNLAVTLSRYDRRTALLDLDMRQPALAKTLGVADPGPLGDWLRGRRTTAEAFLRFAPNALRIGPHLALGLNGRREPFAAELFHDPLTAEALARLERELRPDVVLVDLPPALAQDDVLAMKPHLDCLLLIAGGGQTTPRELKETMRRIGDDLPVLGVVLNKAEGEGVYDYSY